MTERAALIASFGGDGTLVLENRGRWSPSTTYSSEDVVFHGDGVWYATADTSAGDEPGASDNWAQLTVAKLTEDIDLDGHSTTEEINQLINQAIANEVAARQSADTALGDRITAEENTRSNADTALDTRVTELENAEPTNVDLSGHATTAQLNAETTAREAEDTALGARIDSEVADRQAINTQQSSALNNEISARTSADNALGTRIDNEITARTDADNALGTRIDNLPAQIPDHLSPETRASITAAQEVVTALAENSPFVSYTLNEQNQLVYTRLDGTEAEPLDFPEGSATASLSNEQRTQVLAILELFTFRTQLQSELITGGQVVLVPSGQNVNAQREYIDHLADMPFEARTRYTGVFPVFRLPTGVNQNDAGLALDVIEDGAVIARHTDWTAVPAVARETEQQASDVYPLLPNDSDYRFALYQTYEDAIDPSTGRVAKNREARNGGWAAGALDSDGDDIVHLHIRVSAPLELSPEYPTTVCLQRRNGSDTQNFLLSSFTEQEYTGTEPQTERVFISDRTYPFQLLADDTVDTVLTMCYLVTRFETVETAPAIPPALRTTASINLAVGQSLQLATETPATSVVGLNSELVRSENLSQELQDLLTELRSSLDAQVSGDQRFVLDDFEVQTLNGELENADRTVKFHNSLSRVAAEYQDGVIPGFVVGVRYAILPKGWTDLTVQSAQVEVVAEGVPGYTTYKVSCQEVVGSDAIIPREVRARRTELNRYTAPRLALNDANLPSGRVFMTQAERDSLTVVSQPSYRVSDNLAEIDRTVRVENRTTEEHVDWASSNVNVLPDLCGVFFRDRPATRYGDTYPITHPPVNQIDSVANQITSTGTPGSASEYIDNGRGGVRTAARGKLEGSGVVGAVLPIISPFEDNFRWEGTIEYWDDTARDKNILALSAVRGDDIPVLVEHNGKFAIRYQETAGGTETSSWTQALYLVDGRDEGVIGGTGETVLDFVVPAADTWHGTVELYLNENFIAALDLDQVIADLETGIPERTVNLNYIDAADNNRSHPEQVKVQYLNSAQTSTYAGAHGAHILRVRGSVSENNQQRLGEMRVRFQRTVSFEQPVAPTYGYAEIVDGGNPADQVARQISWAFYETADATLGARVAVTSFTLSPANTGSTWSLDRDTKIPIGAIDGRRLKIGNSTCVFRNVRVCLKPPEATSSTLIEVGDRNSEARDSWMWGLLTPPVTREHVKRVVAVGAEMEVLDSRGAVVSAASGKRFTSPLYNVDLYGTPYTRKAAHGLGRVPDYAYGCLVCKEATSGYEVGDVIYFNEQTDSDEPDERRAIWCSSTEIGITFSSIFFPELPVKNPTQTHQYINQSERSKFQLCLVALLVN